MTAMLMVYAVAIGLPLAAIGLLLDRIASYRRRPRRWIWASIVMLQIVLAALAPWRSATRDVPRPASSAVRSPERPLNSAALSIPAANLSATWREALGAWLDDVTALAARWNRTAIWIWIFASAAVLCVFGVASIALSVRRRSWRSTIVRDTRVLVSNSEGPAVVGVRTPQIVVPEWALALEPRALDLMLRHEHEHVLAGDPRLIHVCGAALVAMPWNPALWWMLSRLRLAVEIDCDARVLGAAGAAADNLHADAPVYGELLLTVVSHRVPRRVFSAPAMLEPPSTLSRRITAMYPQRLRLTGLRAGIAGVAALALALVIFVIPAPRPSAQSKEDSGAPASKHLGGASSAPAFHAPKSAAVKSLVQKYAPEFLQHEPEIVNVTTRGGGTLTIRRNPTVVFIVNEAGDVTGLSSMRVLERVLKAVNPPAPEPTPGEIQAREERSKQEQLDRAKANVETNAGWAAARVTPEQNDQDEAKARAEMAEADQQAADLLSRLISIDLIHYAAGDLGPDPLNVYFVSVRGGEKRR